MINFWEVVASPQNEACSIASFAKEEGRQLREYFKSKNIPAEVLFLQPKTRNEGTHFRQMALDSDRKNLPEVLLVHIPSILDRRPVWNLFVHLWFWRRNSLRTKTKFVLVLHEFFEAPWHWKLRAMIAVFFCDILIVNTAPDFSALQFALKWLNKPMFKIHLAPPLSQTQEFSQVSVQHFTAEISRARAEISKNFKNQKWPSSLVLTIPGLVTSGKGIEDILTLSRELQAGGPTHLLLVGGQGPTPEDETFLKMILQECKKKWGENFTYLKDRADAEFQQILLGSDMVVLPFPGGVSERRSSFLTACASGAHVWTRTGRWSGDMQLEQSGALVGDQLTSVISEVAILRANGLSLERSIESRAKNIAWAQRRDWPTRISKLLAAVKESDSGSLV